MNGARDGGSKVNGQDESRPPTETAALPGHDYESLLWLLSDSNLPTGGFVASAGLESFFAHGFLHDVGVPAVPGSAKPQQSNSESTAVKGQGSSDQVASSTASFLYLSLSSYARTAIPFILDVHAVASKCLALQDVSVADCLTQIIRLDDAYHTMTLNHVLRRASKAQGIALLTLYSKSFADEPDIGAQWSHTTAQTSGNVGQASDRAANLMSNLKRRIRVASPRDESPYGHLPICWAAFCAALGIPIESTIKLHLFLQARAILSSSIRLNTLGPYLAHSMLHHQVCKVLAEVLRSHDWVCCATSGLRVDANSTSKMNQRYPKATAFNWDWPEEGSWDSDERHSGTDTISPANTWPLGEIIQARHDSLHSRLFNS